MYFTNEKQNAMNRIRSLYITAPENFYRRIFINYIVYERNDDGLLLDCEIETNNHRFHTTICLDFQELNRLMGVLSSQHDIDLYELISEHIVSDDNSVCEVNLLKELGHPIVLQDYSLELMMPLQSAEAS